MQDTTYVVHKNSYGLLKNVMRHLVIAPICHLKNYMTHNNRTMHTGII